MIIIYDPEMDPNTNGGKKKMVIIDISRCKCTA